MFVEAKKGLWTQKKSFGPLKMLKKLIFGPQKMEKIDFLQNLDLLDLAEYGRAFPQRPTSIPNKLFSWLIYINKATVGNARNLFYLEISWFMKL